MHCGQRDYARRVVSSLLAAWSSKLFNILELSSRGIASEMKKTVVQPRRFHLRKQISHGYLMPNTGSVERTSHLRNDRCKPSSFGEEKRTSCASNCNRLSPLRHTINGKEMLSKKKNTTPPRIIRELHPLESYRHCKLLTGGLTDPGRE